MDHHFSRQKSDLKVVFALALPRTIWNCPAWIASASNCIARTDRSYSCFFLLDIVIKCEMQLVYRFRNASVSAARANTEHVGWITGHYMF